MGYPPTQSLETIEEMEQVFWQQESVKQKINFERNLRSVFFFFFFFC